MSAIPETMLELKTRDNLADVLKLRVFVNGHPRVVSLSTARELSQKSEYSWIVPVDQMTICHNNMALKQSAVDVATESGCEFGLALMTRRSLSLTLEKFREFRPHLRRLKKAAFHTRARRFRDLMKHLPTKLHVFRGVRVLDGPYAGEFAYQARRDRSYVVIVGAGCGFTDDQVPWEIFSGS